MLYKLTMIKEPTKFDEDNGQNMEFKVDFPEQSASEVYHVPT
jgi:hypothetical protein